MYAPRTRFVPEDVVGCFERRAAGGAGGGENGGGDYGDPTDVMKHAAINVAAKLREMWT